MSGLHVHRHDGLGIPDGYLLEGECAWAGAVRWRGNACAVICAYSGEFDKFVVLESWSIGGGRCVEGL